MTATAQKTVKVIADNSRVMDSTESAYLSVTSPTGKIVYLKKSSLIRVSDELRAIFWKCANNPMERFIGEIELTIEEMRLVLEFSKL